MAFDIDEVRAVKKTSEFPRNIDDMSIEALQEYVAEMQAEIARAEENIKKKEESKLAADSFFS